MTAHVLRCMFDRCDSLPVWNRVYDVLYHVRDRRCVSQFAQELKDKERLSDQLVCFYSLCYHHPHISHISHISYITPWCLLSVGVCVFMFIVLVSVKAAKKQEEKVDDNAE